MIWLVWHLATIALSFVWLVGGVIGPRLYYTEAAAAAITIGTLGASWIVYLVSCALSSLSEFGVLLSTGIMFVAARSRYASFIREHQAMRARGLRRDDWLALAVTVGLSLFLYPTYSARMIPMRDGKTWAGGSCYGDLPIHMTIAESFLVGCNQNVSWGTRMISPIFAGHHMTYPFLPDFHAAIIVRLGGSMRDGFFLPGFLMSAALWALLYFFTLRVTKSRLGGVLAVLMVIFAGGLGGWRWIASFLQEHGLAGAWQQALKQDVVQHDSTGEWKFLWFAFVPHIMLPQRGANFAYPMAVLVLILVWMATDSATRLHCGHRRTLLVTAGVFAASLPMAQAHSFIGVGIIIGTIAVLDCHKWLADAHLFWSWVYAGIAALALALPQMTQFRSTVSQGYYGKFLQYGWLFNNYEFGEPHNNPLGLLRFWWYSLGPAFYLFLAAMVLTCLEMVGARRLATRLIKDSGSGAVSHYLADIAAQAGAADLIGEPNPIPPAPKSALTSPGARPLPATVPAWSRAVGLDTLDGTFAPLNSLSTTGRAWDCFKLMLGGLFVFLVSNYINFQPWDRDNAKIYYVFLFIAAPINGALLAAPIEYFAAQQWAAAPGKARIARWFGSTSLNVRDEGDTAQQQQQRQGGSDAQARPAPATRRRVAEVSFAHLARLAAPVLFLLCTLSGAMLMMQEYRDAMAGGGVLLDEDAHRMGEWVRRHVPPQAVVMHSNYHVQPSGALAGRPSLVAYYGWVSNHGYNANERLGDRDYAMDNACKDSDPHAYALMRKWGVRYVLGEWIKKHDRQTGHNPDVFLDGQLKRVFSSGRYELFQVMGF